MTDKKNDDPQKTPTNGQRPNSPRKPSKKTHKTDYQLRRILKHNRDGSPDRQSERHRILLLCITQLQALGYGPRWDLNKLGRKEVSRLVNGWRAQKLKHRTVANRMVEIRWLADYFGRLDQIPSNKDLGVGLRKNDPDYGRNKAEELDPARLRTLPEREQLITELRRHFGLRTEESLKFQHRLATRTPGCITLKGSWCKGGRPRVVPITNPRQAELLYRVGQYQAAHRDKSMIPHHRTYLSYYKEYNKLRKAANIPGHGLRHQWAQDRFKVVSGGIAAPLAGGPAYSSLNDEEKARWELAAQTVNQELGHGAGRHDITSTYIGPRD